MVNFEDKVMEVTISAHRLPPPHPPSRGGGGAAEGSAVAPGSPTSPTVRTTGGPSSLVDRVKGLGRKRTASDAESPVSPTRELPNGPPGARDSFGKPSSPTTGATTAVDSPNMGSTPAMVVVASAPKDKAAHETMRPHTLQSGPSASSVARAGASAGGAGASTVAGAGTSLTDLEAGQGSKQRTTRTSAQTEPTAPTDPTAQAPPLVLQPASRNRPMNNGAARVTARRRSSLLPGLGMPLERRAR